LKKRVRGAKKNKLPKEDENTSNFTVDLSSQIPCPICAQSCDNIFTHLESDHKPYNKRYDNYDRHHSGHFEKELRRLAMLIHKFRYGKSSPPD
jgi:hypothetical protein